MRYDVVLLAVLPTGHEAAAITLHCGETFNVALNKATHLSRTLDPETTLDPDEYFVVDSLIEAVRLRWPAAHFDVTMRPEGGARWPLRG